MVSHELRNSLSPALTAATYLEQLPDLPQRAREMAAVIKRNIELEARLIDDLLDVSRLERGRIDLRVRPVNVHEVLERAVDSCSDLARNQRVTMTIDLGATEHHPMAGEARLQQVFWNLLTNAVKFSHAGDFVLVRTTSDDEGTLSVTVRDFGQGMNADTVDRLFMPFETPPSSNHSARMGLGLGLTIARGIVEAHGGQIFGSSGGPNEGSLFEVRLVTCAESRPKPDQDEGERGRQDSGNGTRRVLIIEDDTDSGALMSIYLGRLGYNVRIAHSLRCQGLEALDEPWDVVMSDIGLGDGSGLEIARRVKQRRCSSP